MNKIGIYFAFWEKEWEADYCRYIEKAKKLGFDVLELAAGCLPDMTAAQRREIASRQRMRGSTSPTVSASPQYDLACEDASVRASGIRYVGELLKCIRQMGGDTLGGIIYSCWPGVRSHMTIAEGQREKPGLCGNCPIWQRNMISITAWKS